MFINKVSDLFSLKICNLQTKAVSSLLIACYQGSLHQDVTEDASSTDKHSSNDSGCFGTVSLNHYQMGFFCFFFMGQR